ncbi:MAG: NYN domain-containing protein [Nocardioidaceae bacterium]
MAQSHVPAPLRRAASFAPAKRARLVGSQIVQYVEGDDDFREHLATQVKALAPGVCASLEAADEISDDDLVEGAAVAAILRPDGWEDLVERARALEEQRRVSPSGDLQATVEKLTRDLDQARGETKEVRERLKAQIEDLKSDNTTLRHKLGETRGRVRDADAKLAEAEERLQAARRDAEVAAREAEAEARRLRQRITELETESSTTRRLARDEREAESVRLRLLLETLMETSMGLRRELALPPTDATPADSVDAVAPGVASGVAGVGRALLQDDPGLLRKLLELPRVHLVVDGYNVSKTAWPTAPLDQQRSRLVSGVAALVAGKGIETTIVFDGADLKNPPMVTSLRGVRVRFSPPGVIADDLIRQLVAAEPEGRPLVVVSTDREVAESVTKKGARSVASIALVKAMGV